MANQLIDLMADISNIIFIKGSKRLSATRNERDLRF